MDETQPHNAIIDTLVADLSPVRPIRPGWGMAGALALTALAILIAAFGIGLRGDLALGRPHDMFFLRAGLLALVGFTTGWAALALARPGPAPGRRSRAPWQAAIATAALLPIAAAIRYVSLNPDAAVFAPSRGIMCVGFSIAAALVIGGAMTWWLRRGAPVRPKRAGWLVGCAAGSFGARAYGFSCPIDSLIYIGTWYTLSVLVCTGLGRLMVPPLLRW